MIRCDMEAIEPGFRRRVRCKRCGWESTSKTGSRIDRIDRECRIKGRLSYPWLHELGNWFWLCLEAHFITKTARCRGKCDARQKAANELGRQLLAPGERMG